MNLASKKIELIEWLTQVESEETLIQLDSLRKNSLEIQKMSNEEFKAMLDQSEDEYKKGNVIPHKNLEQESENW